MGHLPTLNHFEPDSPVPYCNDTQFAVTYQQKVCGKLEKVPLSIDARIRSTEALTAIQMIEFNLFNYRTTLERDKAAAFLHSGHYKICSSLAARNTVEVLGYKRHLLLNFGIQSFLIKDF